MNIGFALTGSYCTYAQSFPILELLSRDHNVTPIFSINAANTDTRFGSAEDHLTLARELTGKDAMITIPQAEPIGPKGLFDILIIAPCTGNTLAKISHGIADTPVTMAAKSQLRNGRPVLLAIATNDGLSGAAENIGRLLNRKNIYFVPFGQDDPIGKPTSLISDFGLIPLAAEDAAKGIQHQPILL